MKQVVLAGEYKLEYDDFVVCQCWTWTNMLNCVYCSRSEHEDPVLCVVAELMYLQGLYYGCKLYAIDMIIDEL